ncbi:MAG: hypothetical protein GJV46_09925 [Geobacter sp.]|nr:hypothetical protein [Geobacter sp.]
MIPGKDNSNVRADNEPSPAIRSAGFNKRIEYAGGQNAMIKREAADTIPLLHLCTAIDNYRDVAAAMQALISDCRKESRIQSDSALV